MSPLPITRSLCVALSCAIFACGDSDKQGTTDTLVDVPTDPTDGSGDVRDTASDSAADTTADTADLDTADTPDAPPLCETEGGFGCECTANEDCNGGFCIDGPDGRLCTRICIDTCPDGFDCRQTVVAGADPVSICVPRHVSLCRPCDAHADCRLGADTTALCVPGAAPEDGSFCATSCATTSCPDGYTCEDVTTGGASARVCRSVDGVCACRPSWAAMDLTTSCARTNAFGTCAGTRACAADGLTECSAATAAEEVCNDLDDDCDGTPDDLAATVCELATSGIDTTCPGLTACADGDQICTGRAPAFEICNDVDDDCDGTTDEAFGDCLDSGCVAAGGGFVQNGAPGCANGQCTYENPKPCGYFTCAGQGGAGDVCATSCDDDSRCLPNATCVAHACVCRTGYAGPTCEACADGYQDKDGDLSCLPSCALLPCIQGTCDDSTGVASCACTEGHIGPACDACDAPAYTDPDGDTLCERRGEVVLGAPPTTIARVGKVYRYTLTATQAGWMPDDEFTFSLMAGPATMQIGADGAIAWTPAPEDQTWHEDPAQRTSITLTVRATAPDGQYAEHTVELEVLPAVFVDGLHPAAGRGAGGEPVLVFGRGFVGPAGSIGVAFGDLPAASVTVIDQYTLSVTTPPAPARTRPLVIVLDGDPEVELRPGFTHLPAIAYASATSLPLNSNLLVNGEGFDPSSVSANVASFPGRGRTERRVRVSVEPDGSEAEFSLGVGLSESTLGTGAFQVLVNGLSSNALPLIISDSPLPARLAVTSIDAPRAPGESMKLRGAGFAGLTPDALTVAFMGADGPLPATVTAINAAGTEVSVTVPAGALTGPLALSATGRLAAMSFVPAVIPNTTPPLHVTDLTPALGAPGEAVILRGQGFVAATPEAHAVTFSGTPARVLSAEATRLVVEVPAGLPLGPTAVAVTVGGRTDRGQVFGMSADFERIAGGGAGAPVPVDASPMAVPVSANSVAADASGLLLLSDGKRLRALNTTAAPLTAFGQTIPAGALGVLAEQPSIALAVRPLGGDLFFAHSNAIWRMRRSDGVISQYAGQLVSGLSGDGGHRQDATFNAPLAIDFTSDSILVIVDYNNGGIRAINTTGSTKTRWGLTLAPDIVQTVEFWGPQSNPGLAIGPDDSLYVATFTQVFEIRADRLPKTDPQHVARVLVAGAGGAGVPTAVCPASASVLGTNNYLATDRVTGDLFIGSRHGIVRRIFASGGSDPTRVDRDDCVEDYAGLALTAAGVPRPGHAGDGGPAREARIALLPRPFTDHDGALLIGGNGFVRRVTPAATAAERVITSLAGAMPPALDGMRGLDLDAVVALGGVEVDPIGDRYIYNVGARVLAQSRTTGRVTVLAGTGLDGNLIADDGRATASDIANLRGVAVREGRHLIILESVLPRVSSVDLQTGTIGVLAGDGRTAIGSENTFTGPAASARVDVNTGRPKATIGPDGLLYFGNGNLVRVINPIDAPVTTFGITLPAGHIANLPTTLGANISRVAFDPQGNLYVGSLSANRLARLRVAAPTTVERLIEGDTNAYGYSPAGRLSELRTTGITDLTFMPNGDLLISILVGNVLVYVRANPDGSLDGNCQFTTIFGTGAPGSWRSGLPPSAQSLGVTAHALDGGTLLFSDAGRLFALDLP